MFPVLISVFELLVLGVLVLPFILVYIIHKSCMCSRKRPKIPLNILITGANSGIGEALSLHYAKQGVTLALIGRNKERLEKVSNACKTKGAVSIVAPLDVTDRIGMEKFILDFDRAHPVDLVIANAGVSARTGGFSRDIVQSTRQLFAINVDGVFNTVLPLIAPMKERGSGQIAIMSSIAGTGVLPDAPDYSATKVAIRVWGEGLRALLYRDNVFVNIICPGFIESPMTDIGGEYRLPMLQKMAPSIVRITSSLAADEPVTIFPRPLYSPLWLMNLLPPDVRHTLARASWIPGFAYLRTRRSKDTNKSNRDDNKSDKDE